MSDAIALCSGGIDSTAALYYAVKHDNRVPVVLHIYYGQRNEQEHKYARYHADKLGLEFVELDITQCVAPLFNTSALVNKQMQVDTQLDPHKQPNTYVPFRNLLLFTLAAAFAESRGMDPCPIYSGIQKHTKYHYWDTTDEFVNAVNKVFATCNKQIYIVTPFVNMTKGELMNYMLKNKYMMLQDFTHTWSCYSDGEQPCGRCGACQERMEAFMYVGYSLL